jgi:acetyl-CoA carboxylase alpha subunit
VRSALEELEQVDAEELRRRRRARFRSLGVVSS